MQVMRRTRVTDGTTEGLGDAYAPDLAFREPVDVAPEPLVAQGLLRP